MNNAVSSLYIWNSHICYITAISNNSNLKKEGHFVNGSAENWWIIYEIGTLNKTKVQYQNNKKNGYALCYKNNELIRAEKYINNSITGSWTTIIAFRQDNPDASL